MKFGKNLNQVVQLSDPEWGPFWMNYKYLKKKINDIVEARGGVKVSQDLNCNPNVLSKLASEVEFFKAVRLELKKSSDFFASSEMLYRIRHERVLGGYLKLKEVGHKYDKNTWSRLLRACINLYRDVLLLENFAIMNYCGFSKILKKHDKLTGFVTREAFMRNVMSIQNFTHYPYLLELLKKSEQLFAEIQRMDSVMPLQAEERLFIDAIRDLNFQASQLQAEENDGAALVSNTASDVSDADADADGSSNESTNNYNTSLNEFLNSTPYRLNSAADAVTEAASKINNNHFETASSTILMSALSWMQKITKKTDSEDAVASYLPLNSATVSTTTQEPYLSQELLLNVANNVVEHETVIDFVPDAVSTHQQSQSNEAIPMVTTSSEVFPSELPRRTRQRKYEQEGQQQQLHQCASNLAKRQCVAITTTTSNSKNV